MSDFGRISRLSFIPEVLYYNFLALLDETWEGESIETINPQPNVNVDRQDASSQVYIPDSSIRVVSATNTAKLSLPIPTKPPLSDSFQSKLKRLLEKCSGLLDFQRDQWELTGLSFGMQLRELGEDQQAIAQKLMSDVLYYAKMKKLNGSTSIEISQSLQSSPMHSQNCSISSCNTNYYCRQVQQNNKSHLQPALSQTPNQISILDTVRSLDKSSDSHLNLNEVFQFR